MPSSYSLCLLAALPRVTEISPSFTFECVGRQSESTEIMRQQNLTVNIPSKKFGLWKSGHRFLLCFLQCRNVTQRRKTTPPPLPPPSRTTKIFTISYISPDRPATLASTPESNPFLLHLSRLNVFYRQYSVSAEGTKRHKAWFILDCTSN